MVILRSLFVAVGREEGRAFLRYRHTHKHAHTYIISHRPIPYRYRYLGLTFRIIILLHALIIQHKVLDPPLLFPLSLLLRAHRDGEGGVGG